MDADGVAYSTDQFDDHAIVRYTVDAKGSVSTTPGSRVVTYTILSGI